jgi:solute:Na+ symporter, SSS family
MAAVAIRASERMPGDSLVQFTPEQQLILILLGCAYILVIIFTGLAGRRHSNSGETFLHTDRKLPSWVTNIAFLTANCSALEIIGIIAISAKYGILAVHFYWIGAIPAILILMLVVMPIYARSKVKSVPQYMEQRYNASTRMLSAALFGIMMVFIAGITLSAMALLVQLSVGLSYGYSIAIFAVFASSFVTAGGLSAIIFSEIIQFSLVLCVLVPLTALSLREFHGWGGLSTALPFGMVHAWKGLALVDRAAVPMDALGMVLGLGVVLSGGYWCTDFMLIQRALVAKDDKSMVQTPIFAVVGKLLLPIVLVVPGLAAVKLFGSKLNGSFDLALPMLMQRYFTSWMPPFGICALMASLFSGLCGNVSACNTAWIHDIYRPYLVKGRPDRHYLLVARASTVAAIGMAVLAALLALHFNALMDYIQLVLAVFNAPLLALMLFGMFTRWATPWAGLSGLLAGTIAGAAHNIAGRIGLLHYGSGMSANFYGAIVAFTTASLLISVVSLFTKKSEPTGLADTVFDRNKSQNSSGMIGVAVAIALVTIAVNVYFR